MAKGPTGYFNPNTTVSTLRVPPAEQEALLAKWEESLRFFEAHGGYLPMPPVHSAYLPPGFSADNGAYLRELPIADILAGKLDQQWWWFDNLGSDRWDKGKGVGNGYRVGYPPARPSKTPQE